MDLDVNDFLDIHFEGLHSLANPRSNQALAKLCDTLNAREIRYPGTDLKLVYEAPEGPDVA